MSKLFLFILAVVLFGGGALFVNRANNGQLSVQQPVPTAEVDEGSGVLEGSIGYPSEVIPESMIVCAENIQSGEMNCTSEQIEDEQFTHRVGYRMTVPAGSYTVFAYLAENENQKAYYNDFVVCGLSVECESHEPIVIEVKANQTTSGVDPLDWYQINPDEGYL